MTGKLISYPIDNKSDYKAWALDHPNAHRLLREILFRWRGSNIKKRGWRGHWTVYPLERWAEWSGLSPHQLKRELKRLEVDGLLRRTRGRFQGSTVRSYLQPTPLAVDHAGKAGDKERLGAAYSTTDAPAAAPLATPSSASTSAPAGAPTDHTSFPFHPEQINLSKKATGVLTPTLEKGSAGEDESNEAAIDDDELAFLEGQKKLKKLKSEKDAKAFPILTGKHETAVRHPSELYPDRWLSFSPEVRSKLYQRYKRYVENWHKARSSPSLSGGNGWKEATDWSNWTDEDDAALVAAFEKKKAMKPAKLK